MTLKDLVVMHGKEMASFTRQNGGLDWVENVLGKDRHIYPEIDFGEHLWNDMARELRGVSLLYDDYEDFWSDFVPWWKMRALEFARLFVTVVAQYNILHNYDRTESVTEKTQTKANERSKAEDTRQGENEATQEQTAQDSTTTAGTVKDVVVNTDTSTEKVNGFNSPEDDLSTKGQTVRTLDGVTTSNTDNATTGESNANASGRGRHSESGTAQGEKDSTGSVETVREVRMYGNIGVTTAQQMLTEERRLMSDHVVSYIVKEFKRAFCLLVY